MTRRGASSAPPPRRWPSPMSSRGLLAQYRFDPSGEAGTMKTGLVLSGGAAQGSFEVGALRFLYSRNSFANIICSTSVGSVNGIQLAHGGTERAQGEAFDVLKMSWEGELVVNDDMYEEAPWLAGVSPGCRCPGSTSSPSRQGTTSCLHREPDSSAKTTPGKDTSCGIHGPGHQEVFWAPRRCCWPLEAEWPTPRSRIVPASTPHAV